VELWRAIGQRLAANGQTKLIGVLFLLSASALASSLHADTFGGGANSFDVEFVTIGNPGNPPDANPNPAGAVPYVYRIGKYEISEQMIDKAGATQFMASGGLIGESRIRSYLLMGGLEFDHSKRVSFRHRHHSPESVS
jgi:hypothetical protein